MWNSSIENVFYLIKSQYLKCVTLFYGLFTILFYFLFYFIESNGSKDKHYNFIVGKKLNCEKKLFNCLSIFFWPVVLIKKERRHETRI